MVNRLKQEMKRHLNYMHYKTKAFAVLGDRCVRCGFTDKRALQIDHKNPEYKKQCGFNSGINLYLDVLKNPEQYQILCANCNWIKRAENKESPTTKAKDYLDSLDVQALLSTSPMLASETLGCQKCGSQNLVKNFVLHSKSMGDMCLVDYTCADCKAHSYFKRKFKT